MIKNKKLHTFNAFNPKKKKKKAESLKIKIVAKSRNACLVKYEYKSSN